MQFASALIELGLLPADRVALIATNRPEWVITDLGTMHAACIHTPLYPSLAADAIKAILSDSGTRLVICATDRQLQAVLSAENELPALEQVVCLFDPGHVKSSRKLWSWESVLDLGSQHLSRHQAEIYRRLAALRTHDVCSLVYTSGTTGEPKGAMIMHGNFCSNVQAALSLLEFRSDDVEHLLAEVAECCAELTASERVKAIALLPWELSEKNGELTPTQKVKRKVVHQKYLGKIRALYQEMD